MLGRPTVSCSLLVATLLFGCAAWRDSSTETFQLPRARMSPDSVALEITFVPIPTGRDELEQQLWKYVDEQHLEAMQRTHLNTNGFRCGLVGPNLPDELRRVLGIRQSNSKLSKAVPRDVDVLTQYRRMPCRSGHRSEIVTTTSRDSLDILHKDSDSQRVKGRTFVQAQCILATRCFPQGDGRVRVELVPEIHHGTPRARWVAGEGTFHMRAGRDHFAYGDLAINSVLSPGQTLILTSANLGHGIGGAFFIDSEEGEPQQKMLLIRLAFTQRDDLFDSDL